MRRLALCALVVLSGCAAPARPGTDQAAPDETASSTSAPISDATPDGETLLASPPQGWVRVGGADAGAIRLAEYVPQAELEKNPEAAQGGWKEKITFEQLEGQPVPDPLEFLEGLRTDHLESCPDGGYAPVAAAEENGYPTAVALVDCPKLGVTDAGQVTMLKVIQGDAAFYTVTRSIRVPPWKATSAAATAEPTESASEISGSVKAPAETPVDPAVIGGFSVWLRAISLCNSTDADHPCKPTASDATRSP